MTSPAVTLFFVGLLLLGSSSTPVGAQPKFEFRGVWVTTVLNLDWPRRGASPADQQEAFEALLDGVEAAGLNAVFLQVRPEADAFYASDVEPWSYYLTGTQGQAPEPFWDPLAFAVEAAHRRGLELHAWFNPFRVRRSQSAYPVAESHLLRTHPDWLLELRDGQGRTTYWLDPGIPDARQYVIDLMVDVAERYAIDGVHLDDYFYPYPSEGRPGVTSEDAFTFSTYGGGFSSVAEWRRHNINTFVADTYAALMAADPALAFGVSPFGIWKSGVPAGITGLSAYDDIYVDAVAWLQSGTLDYLVPQLYWPFGGNQDFGALATWWSEQVGDRHLYLGHALYRADPVTEPTPSRRYARNEVPVQAGFGRASDAIQGSVFFRAQNVATLPSQDFVAQVTDPSTGLYRLPALPPPMIWKDLAPPPPPVAASREPLDGAVRLSWQPPADDGFAPPARFYVVYRLPADAPTDAAPMTPDAIVGVTADTMLTDRPPDEASAYTYLVTAVSPNSIESVPAEATAATTADEAMPPLHFALDAPYPNPAAATTALRFRLDRPDTVRLEVVDVLGRRAALVYNGLRFGAGRHEVVWEARDGEGFVLPSGSYLVSLTVGGRTLTQPLTIVR